MRESSIYREDYRRPQPPEVEYDGGMEDVGHVVRQMPTLGEWTKCANALIEMIVGGTVLPFSTRFLNHSRTAVSVGWHTSKTL